MPRTLLERCQADCVFEFRAAARQRARDAQQLVESDRRTAAIYLFGYSAEMTLKASYFTVIGFSDLQQISIADLHAARLSAPALGVAPLRNLHDVRGWAELLVATRAALPGLAYSWPTFANQVISVGTRIDALWRELLRYRKNVAYEYELAQVQSASQWLLVNSSRL